MQRQRLAHPLLWAHGRKEASDVIMEPSAQAYSKEGQVAKRGKEWAGSEGLIEGEQQRTAAPKASQGQRWPASRRWQAGGRAG